MDSYSKDCLELLKRMRNYRAVKFGRKDMTSTGRKRKIGSSKNYVPSICGCPITSLELHTK